MAVQDQTERRPPIFASFNGYRRACSTRDVVAAASIRAHAPRPGVRAVVIDAESIAFIDISAANVLAHSARDLEASGGGLALAHDVGQERDLLRVADVQELVEAVYPTVQAAVEAVA